MNFAVLPLLLAAFFLRAIIPATGLDFAIALLLDDVATMMVASSLSFSIPHSNRITKFVSIVYACFTLHVFLHNVIASIGLKNVEAMQDLASIVVLAMCSILSASSIYIGSFQKFHMTCKIK